MATPIFILAISYIIGSRKYLRDSLIALVLTGAIYAIFEKLLQVSVP